MKCKYCGGEIDEKGKTCPFCGSRISLEEQKELEQINKQGCPKCGSTNIEFSREKAGTVKNRKGNQTVLYRTNGLCKDCGHTWTTNSSKRSRTWLWVLGWIFIFPLPLTIILVRNKKIKPWLKFVIIGVAWLIYIIFALVYSSDDSGNSGTTPPVTTNQQANTNATETRSPVIPSKTESNTTVENTEAASTVPVEYDGNFMIDSFVSAFNDASDVDLEYVEDFVPSDHSSGHYRTEFRLNAYREATGKSYMYDGIIIDIVCHDNMVGDPSVRLYGEGLSIEQITALIDKCSPLFDTDITASDVQNAIKYVNEHHEANGYYYGDLGLLVLGNDNTGYSLMIKND